MSTSKKNTTKKNSLALHLQLYWHIYAALGVVAITGIVLAWLYRFQINPDGISYIQVAKEYAGFHLKTAINGYWSPLLSWLLVPFIWIGIDPLIAFRAVNLGIVLGIIGGLLYAFHRRPNPPSRTMQFLFASSLGLTLAAWATTIVTPDIVSGALLLAAICLTYHYAKARSLMTACLLGACLAFLYFSKSIGFYIAIIIASVLLLHELYSLRRLTRPTLAMVAIFAVLSAIWVGLISVKYQTLTISTASSYNFAMQSPAHPSHPIALQGSLEVHSSRAIWAWDDPSYFKLPSWSIFENLPYYIGHISMMTSFTVMYLLQLSPLFLLGALAFFVTKRDRPTTIATIALGIGSLATLGVYSLLYVEPRYLWIIAVPIMVIGGLLFARQTLPQVPSLAILGLIFTATIISTIPTIRDGMEVQFHQSNLKQLADESRQHIDAYSRMAGDNVFEYCYFSTTQCRGNYALTGEVQKDQPVIDKMRSEGIQYYVSLSDKPFPYLQSIYHGQSQPNPIPECFDALSRRYRDCKETTVTIYKL